MSHRHQRFFKSLSVAAFLVAGVMPVLPAAHAAGDSYFYSGGKRHALQTSSQWLAVQVEDETAVSTVQSKARTTGTLDTSRAPRRLKRFGIVALPLKTSSSNAARSSLRTATKNAKGVRRVLRAFGNGKKPIIETDEFLVQFKPGMSRDDAAQLLGKRGAVLVKKLGSYAPGGYRARVVNPDATAAAISNELYEAGLVVFAHPNFIWPKERRFVPNDPMFTSQWHLRNTGQNSGLAGADIKAVPAWDITRGSSSVTIAIMDDGVDRTHEDLGGARMLAGYDFVDGDSDPSPEVGDGHGTACAGVAAASHNNSLGVSGMAPNCKILPIRIIGDSTVEDEADAFAYAAAQGADILSNSWGPSDGLGIQQPMPDVVSNAINAAATTGRGGKGCIILFAAGNGSESADLDGYSSHPNVISVAASTNQGQHSGYSDYGNSVDVNAPSSGGTLDITTTDDTGTPGFSFTNYATNFTGTSSACPLVAGVAALLLSRNSALTKTQVQSILQSTADKIGSGYNSQGHSPLFGYGRINALAALQSIANFSVAGRVTLSNGSGVAGVKITSSTGASTTTDSNGNYTLAQAGRGAITITPTLASAVFTPVNRSLNLTANQTGVNFTATPYSLAISAPANRATIARSAAVEATTTNDALTTRIDFDYRCKPFTRTITVNKPIPDGSTTGLVSLDNNGRTGRAGSATVSVNISHTFIGELIVSLISPDGQEFVLHNKEGGRTGNLNATYVLPISSPAPQIAGNWRLKVVDTADGDIGTLNSWSLSISPTWGIIGSDTNGPTAGKWSANWNLLPLPSGVYYLRARALADGKTVQSPVYSVTIAPGLRISGRVTNSAGVGVAGVKIARTDSTATVTTDSNGNYTLTNLYNAKYTVTPSLAGAFFAPASRYLQLAGADLTGINFTAMPPVLISTPAKNSTRSSLASANGTASSSVGSVASVQLLLYRFANGSTPAGYWTGGTTWSASYSAPALRTATGTASWSLAMPALANTKYRLQARGVTATGTGPWDTTEFIINAAGSTATASSVALSSASASADGTIRLTFTGALGDSAADVARYSVDDGAIAVESAAVESNAVTLSTDAVFTAGQSIVVTWNSLQDSSGRAVADGTARITVR
ncbi:MAG TPA: S8 family serine peptidase [Abditibacteriaceae bacterium]|jgi:subtilisin family serine protease